MADIFNVGGQIYVIADSRRGTVQKVSGVSPAAHPSYLVPARTNLKQLAIMSTFYAICS